MLVDIQLRTDALKSEEEHLQAMLQQISLLISDRIHQVEMIPIPEEDCAYFVRELRGAMIERRKIKNELAAVQIAQGYLQETAKKDMRESLQKIERLGRREYHCRVLSDQDILVKKLKTE